MVGGAVCNNYSDFNLFPTCCVANVFGVAGAKMTFEERIKEIEEVYNKGRAFPYCGDSECRDSFMKIGNPGFWLLTKLKEAVNVLKYYGKEELWLDRAGIHGVDDLLLSTTLRDSGKKARNFLKGLEKD